MFGCILSSKSSINSTTISSKSRSLSFKLISSRAVSVRSAEAVAMAIILPVLSFIWRLALAIILYITDCCLVSLPLRLLSIDNGSSVTVASLIIRLKIPEEPIGWNRSLSQRSIALPAAFSTYVQYVVF